MSLTSVKYLGHTTVLVEHDGSRLVLDPNFSTALPFLRRKTPARFDPFELHQVDAVLFTNPRLNRLDTTSLKHFKQRRTRLIVQKGLGNVLNRFFTFDVTEIESDQEIRIGPFAITAFTAPHQSVRFGKRHTSSAHYLIRSPQATVFYVSDTRYDPAFFKLVGERHRIDLAILPIDFQSLGWFNRGNYLTATDALNAFRDLKADKMLPNAYGAFAWRGKNPLAALDTLRKELENDLSLKERVLILEPGADLKLGTEQPATQPLAVAATADVIELRRGS